MTSSHREPPPAALRAAGTALLVLGLLVIGSGWYGAAGTAKVHEQVPFLLSGGLLGLGLTVAGGVLYLGGWLARIAASVARPGAAPDQEATEFPPADSVPADPTPVVAGRGTRVHRRDCTLIAHREDLRVPHHGEAGLTACRACRPALPPAARRAEPVTHHRDEPRPEAPAVEKEATP